MDSWELEQEEIKRNKAIRGFIVRSLVKGYCTDEADCGGAVWSGADHFAGYFQTYRIFGGCGICGSDRRKDQGIPYIQG